MAFELRPGEAFAGYRIDSVLGRGGMGIVYRATQIASGRPVALKLIRPARAVDEGYRKRFEHESALLASIDHANVIDVYEAGEVDGQLFLSMRYVDGPDLRALIAGQGWLAPARAVRIVVQVAAGLDAAHGRGLVHRDVKPANVLIELQGGDEHAYLSDFGLTQELEPGDAPSYADDYAGTADYVAPEQIHGRPIDARSDVYALGCVLFETLTGRAPYVRDGYRARLYAHLHETPPSARELRPRLPAELDDVIAQAMAKDPAKRYRTAGALSRAAIAAVGGQAPTAFGFGAIVPADPDARTGQITRRLNKGEHLVIRRYNRALVQGRSRHMRLSPVYWLVLPLANVAAALWVYASFALMQWVWYGLFAAVVAVSIVAATIAGFRECARLDRDGCLVTAEVTKVDVFRPPHHSSPAEYTVTYRFVTPDGEYRTETTVLRVPPRLRIPAEGAQLAIIYADGVARAL